MADNFSSICDGHFIFGKHVIISAEFCVSSQVRVNALLCLGELIHTLDKKSVVEVLQTIQRCTAVDRSQPTLMCTLSVASSILKQVEFCIIVDLRCFMFDKFILEVAIF